MSSVLVLPTAAEEAGFLGLPDVDVDPYERACMRLALAEACEEHDGIEICRLLPLAARLGVPSAELDGARRLATAIQAEQKPIPVVDPEERTRVRLALAEACEEHDGMEIRRLLPHAARLGVPSAELEGARHLSATIQEEYNPMPLGLMLAAMQDVCDKSSRTLVQQIEEVGECHLARLLDLMHGDSSSPTL